MALPDSPLTRGEQYLSAIAGEDTALPDVPLTRTEQYLAKIAGEDVAVPDVPLTRMEQYLAYIDEHGGGGGGDIALETLNISANGTTNAPSGTAYNKVVTNVQPTGTKQVSISQNGTTTENVASYASAEITANVPNTYAAADEGKVVSNGALVAQTAHATVTENGTIDTTLSNSVTVDVPTGGGGMQLIASGTFTGAGVLNMDFPVGKKMPKKDFIFRVYAPNGTEFANNSDYKVCGVIADSFGTEYDLSSVSDNCLKTNLIRYTISGTSYTPGTSANWYVAYVRTTGTYYQMQTNSGWNRIKRDANGFYIKIANYTSSWYFVSGMEYNWEMLYIGSDPTNDIVEVA